ncbi:MAG: ABC transporter ATP-binding protein [bacterium]|nr:ABC transporter ATP-binding protein [bacterium]
MISLSHTTKKFKDTIALQNITFTAKEGEIIGFLGPNGAGKTTTMRLILGYLTPTSGKVTVDGVDPLKDRIKILRQIGYLPENNPLYSEMRVREYLLFIAEVKGASDIMSYAEDVGLTDVIEKKIEELSRGYKQRVGLAAALVADPPILILDEPTSGLDPLEQEKIRVLIKKIAKKKTIIFSTHILSEVEDVANRLIIINKGSIVYDGSKPKGKGGVEKLFKRLVKS